MPLGVGSILSRPAWSASWAGLCSLLGGRNQSALTPTCLVSRPKQRAVTHFRTRCRFALAPDPDADDSNPANNDLHYLLWEGGTASKHADSFPGAVEGICQLMDPVRIGVSRDPRLRQGVRAVHFMSNTKADDRVVTLVYDQVLLLKSHFFPRDAALDQLSIACCQDRWRACWRCTTPSSVILIPAPWHVCLEA